MQELSAAITRQYIDAVAVFEALADAGAEAAQVRGGMYWHAGPPSSPESKYLVRTTPAGAEKVLARARLRPKPSTTNSPKESRPAPSGLPA